MSKFITKPVEIEAIQYSWDDEAGAMEVAQDAVADFIGSNITTTGEHIEIETDHGPVEAAPGDWIIRGINGEFYPCKPDVFAATYDEVRQDYPRPQTRGEYLVGTTFNPSASDAVSKIKAQAAALIDLIDGRGFPMDDDKGRTGNGEVARCKATAITNIEQGAMWAVKAVTKPHRD